MGENQCIGLSQHYLHLASLNPSSQLLLTLLSFFLLSSGCVDKCPDMRNGSLANLYMERLADWIFCWSTTWLWSSPDSLWLQRDPVRSMVLEDPIIFNYSCMYFLNMSICLQAKGLWKGFQKGHLVDTIRLFD